MLSEPTCELQILKQASISQLQQKRYLAMGVRERGSIKVCNLSFPQDLTVSVILALEV